MSSMFESLNKCDIMLVRLHKTKNILSKVTATLFTNFYLHLSHDECEAIYQNDPDTEQRSIFIVSRYDII